MQPIVNGLQETYTDQIAVVMLNARDGRDGEAAFNALNLPGHPSILVFDESGNETFRQFGIVPEETLIAAIARVLVTTP